jgi:hypothetical protein
MEEEKREKNIIVNRRTFLKVSVVAAVSTHFRPIWASEEKFSGMSRVVRIHDQKATKYWDYSANAPWDHTVEPRPRHGQRGKIKERYFDYINEDVVAAMLDRGVRELTDTLSVEGAWRKLMPGLTTGNRITIKLNMNNPTGDPDLTTNRMNQTMPLVNAVLDHLICKLGIPEKQVTLLDASRWFHPVIEGKGTGT